MLNNSPQVSVIIPCYNHGKYLLETIASIQAQTFASYEILVIDDGSTDKLTISVLLSLSSLQIRVIHSAKRGVSAARNIGINAAKGIYILPLDADDTIAPTFLDRTVSLLEARSDVAVVFCEGEFFGEKSGIKSLPKYDPQALLVDNLIYSSALFRKSDWKRVGGYSEKMVHCWEDWDFWVAMSSLGGMVEKIPEPLFYYRIRSDSRDRVVSFRQKLSALFTMIRRNRNLYYRNAGYITSVLVRRSLSTILHFSMKSK